MDHEEQAQRVYDRIIGDMTPAQKYAQLMALRQMAWEIKAAAVRQQHPGLSEAEVNSQVARIFINATT